MAKSYAVHNADVIEKSKEQLREPTSESQRTSKRQEQQPYAGVEPSSLCSALTLVACAASIYTTYLWYGYIQESLYTTRHGPRQDQKFHYSLFLVGVQSSVNFVLASIVAQLRGGARDQVPNREYAGIAFSYIGAMFCSNFALSFVAYPTQVLAKSCKLIPVMAMRFIALGKRYKVREYITVVLITAGISIFMLFKQKKRKVDEEEDSWIGFALLFFSLVLDGYTGPIQEGLIEKYSPSVPQLMAKLNLFASCYVFVGLVLTGELFEALAFVRAYPVVFRDILTYCCLSAVGQALILTTLFRFNSLVTTTVTTTRKFFTILASVVWFGHSLASLQWVGVVTVFMGLGLDIYGKHASKKAKRA